MKELLAQEVYRQRGAFAKSRNRQGVVRRSGAAATPARSPPKANGTAPFAGDSNDCACPRNRRLAGRAATPQDRCR